MVYKRVVIYEYQDVRYASRARKEALTLSNNSYKVTFIGFKKTIKKRESYLENNIEVVAFPFYFGLKSFSIFLFNYNLFIFLIKNKFDIYHVHNLNSTFITIILKMFSNVKLIYDAHELNYDKRNTKSLRNKIFTFLDVIREKVLIKLSDVILQANYNRAVLFSKYYNCKMPEVIENFEPICIIDKNKSIRKIIDIPKDRIILIFTGNIRYGFNQNVDQIIRALKDIRLDVHFYLLGSVSIETKEILMKLANECNVPDRVHFLEPVPFSDVVHFISGADISVIPIYATNLNSEHSALNKVSQALMAGLPLVATNYNNLTKLLNSEKGYLGETFDITDSKSFADAVNRLLNHDLTQAKRIAREIAEETINWEREGEKLLFIYSKL